MSLPGGHFNTLSPNKFRRVQQDILEWWSDRQHDFVPLFWGKFTKLSWVPSRPVYKRVLKIHWKKCLKLSGSTW